MVKYTRQSKISEVDEGDITPRERAELLATEFDDTIKSLIGTLTHMGMDDEQLETTMDSAKSLMDAALEIYVNRLVGETDPTIEEIEPFTMMCDLVITGVLAHTLFMNRAEVMPQMEEEVLHHLLEKMVRNQE